MPMPDLISFEKTEKQIAACDLLNNYEHTLLVGGARSGKTTIAVRNTFIRAVKVPSRHLMGRLHFNHAKTSLWYDTIPKVLDMCFPGLKVKENKADWFYTIPVQGSNVQESQIWLGGFDDKDRVEKILGNEYSTLLLNEVSQISYDSITTIRTRLAENSGLNLRAYYDLNPVGKKHWTNQEFIEKLIPGSNEKSELDTAYLFLNPVDNVVNLPSTYIKLLKTLPKRQRQRFLEGLYLADVEGALWTDVMVSDAKTKKYGDIKKTVIAVDPATTNNPGSDECGIVCCELDENDEGVVEGDYSGKMSTKKWAQRVVNLYHDKKANEVVAEVNQGGDLVEDVIHNIDRSIKVVKVHASKGKFARAEPVSALYESSESTECKIAHKKDMPELEAEMTEWAPMDSNCSPNRLDALVHGMTHLMIRKQAQIHIG